MKLLSYIPAVSAALIATAATSLLLLPTASASGASETVIALKTFGDARVHFPAKELTDSNSEDDAELLFGTVRNGAWKMMSRAMGVRFDEGDREVRLSGDLFHKPAAGILVVVEGADIPSQFPDPESGIPSFLASSDKVVRTKDSASTAEIVVPLVLEMQEQFPSSLVVTAGGLHPTEDEASPKEWDFIVSQVGGMVRSNRAICKSSAPSDKKCYSKFVMDFTNQKNSKKDAKVENNVVVFNGPMALSLDAEIAAAKKLIDDFGRMHQMDLTDSYSDLLVLRFRISSSTPKDTLEYFNKVLPSLISKFVAQIPEKSAIAQIVFLPPVSRNTATGAQSRRSLASSTTPAYTGSDYLLVSWTVVWVAVLLLVVFLCLPWADTLDTTLRAGFKKDFEDKRD